MPFKNLSFLKRNNIQINPNQYELLSFKNQLLYNKKNSIFIAMIRYFNVNDNLHLINKVNYSVETFDKKNIHDIFHLSDKRTRTNSQFDKDLLKLTKKITSNPTKLLPYFSKTQRYKQIGNHPLAKGETTAWFSERKSLPWSYISLKAKKYDVFHLFLLAKTSDICSFTEQSSKKKIFDNNSVNQLPISLSKLLKQSSNLINSRFQGSRTVRSLGTLKNQNVHNGSMQTNALTSRTLIQNKNIGDYQQLNINQNDKKKYLNHLFNFTSSPTSQKRWFKLFESTETASVKNRDLFLSKIETNLINNTNFCNHSSFMFGSLFST
nr:hypothetical protein [Trentepohlia sp. YN1317]